MMKEEFKNYKKPEMPNYMNLDKVQKDVNVLQMFYSALYDRFVCRMDWKYVVGGDFPDFYGLFAGYYHKKDFGTLHLRIKRYLNGEWDWLLAVECIEKEKNDWKDSSFQGKLKYFYEELTKYTNQFNIRYIPCGGAGKGYYSFAKLTNVPKTSFEDVCNYLERVLKALRLYASKSFNKNAEK